MGLWYVSADGADPIGPFEDELIERGVRAGKIPLDARVCPVGGSEWLALTATPQFGAAIKDVAPPPPPPPSRQAMPVPASMPMPQGYGGQPYQAMPAPQVQQPFGTPMPSGPWAGVVPNPAPQQPSRSGSPQGALMVAVVLTGLTALFWFGIVLLQCVFFITNQKSEVALTALWNSAIVALNVWIATALWGRKRVGYSWGLGTHCLNAILGVYQVLSGAPILILVVPLHAISAILIWVSRGQFPIPAAAAAPAGQQPAPGFSLKRVLIAVGGVVAAIISVITVLFLLNK
jgi:hypothetical protein